MSDTHSPSSATAVLEEGEPVPLENVEHELVRRVKALQSPGEAPVQRACMSNLVIYCDHRELAKAVAAAVPTVVGLHPSRVLLLLGEPEENQAELTARLLVRAHTVAGHRVCSEQVFLHATGAAVQRLPFAVRGLLIGDLPTNLWWAGPQPPALGGVLFYDLSENPEQVLYDSVGWPDPARGVAAVAGWLAQVERSGRGGVWHVASDLNWRRLKYWRRLLGQALDPASAPGLLEGITDLSLEHGPHGVVQAWELVSWLASRLRWRVQAGHVHAGVEISWQFAAPQGNVRVRIQRRDTGPPRLEQMRISWAQSGKTGVLRVSVEEEGRRLAALPEGTAAVARTLTIPPQSLAELVGRQLSDRERDPVFRDSMAVARVLAESILGHHGH